MSTFGEIALYRQSDLDVRYGESADLRRSSFESCSFDRASMKGTMLTRRQGESLLLSALQLSEMNWVDDDGDEPDGG